MCFANETQPIAKFLSYIAFELTAHYTVHGCAFETVACCINEMSTLC